MDEDEARSRAEHPARGTRRPLMLIQGGSEDGPRLRRYIVALVSPFEVYAVDEDAAAAAGPAALVAWLRESAGIAEFMVIAPDDEEGDG
jgi:hypothetical protein